jgi:hypothetical protein
VVAGGSGQQQLCLVNVLDASGSMVESSTIDASGMNRWERTTTALNHVIAGVGNGLNGGVADPDSNVFALITFGNGATLQQGLTSDTAAFKAVVDSLRTLAPPGSFEYTFTEGGIELATPIVCPENSFRVMLLASDGVPTRYDDGDSFPGFCSTSPASFTVCADSAMEAGQDAKAGGWHVVTIGLGLDTLDVTEWVGIQVLDSIATLEAYNIPTPAGVDALVGELVSSLGDLAASNLVLTDTLTSCWSYVTGSTTGDLGTDDPLIGAPLPDGRQLVPYSIPSLSMGDSVEVCFDMAYSVSGCGQVPTTVAFNNGAVTYDTSEGPGQTDEIPGSTEVDMAVCRTILPVELAEFSVVADGRDVLLNWMTASELNNAGFEVQHAFGDGFFEPIGFVEGHGSTHNPHTYRFVASDLQPGPHLFRLKQIDFDGAFEFSEAVEVSVEVPDQYFLSEVYPNPFNPAAAVRFWVTRSQPVEVALHDIQGRRIRTLYEGTPASKASTLVRIDGSGLSSGTYLVRIQGEDFTGSRQVTLLK